MEKKMKLLDIISIMDPNNTVDDYAKISLHSVSCGSSTTVKSRIEKDADVLSYGYNYGNCVVILGKNIGTIAYSCLFYGFPVVSRSFGRLYTWNKIDVKEAEKLIKKDKMWMGSFYDETIDNFEQEIDNNWEELYSGKEILRVWDNKNDYKTVSQYIEERADRKTEIKIFRLKSGKLRIDRSNRRIKISSFIDELLIMKERDNDAVKLGDVKFDWRQPRRILYIDPIPMEILTELKTEALTEKIIEAG